MPRLSRRGDQPAAITELVRDVRAGSRHQVLLGVTGSGKTFTAANVITQVQKPTLVLSPNKILAAQLYAELLKNSSRKTRWSTLFPITIIISRKPMSPPPIPILRRLFGE